MDFLGPLHSKLGKQVEVRNLLQDIRLWVKKGVEPASES